jgi:hypothetical protein
MRKENKAQISLEIATAFLCAFIILLASVKLCTWLVRYMVVRQEDFEASEEYGRVTAGSTNIGVEINESDTNKYPELHFFK